MNWDAIGALGEIVSALAVLITLIYFAVQIRTMRLNSEAELFTKTDEGVRDLQRLCIAHSSLILKANRGDDLSEEEAFQLFGIYRSHQSFYFHGYSRNVTLGQRPIHSELFCRLLIANESFRKLYREDDIMRDGPAKIISDFVTSVDEHLHKTGLT